MKKCVFFLLIVSLLVACQRGQKEPVDPLLQAASYLSEGNPWRAYNLLRRSQADYADQPDYWFLRGQAALRCGNLNEAIKSLEVAVSLAPKEPRYLVKLGYLYVVTNHYQKATSIAQTLLKIDPHNPYAHLILGQVKAFSGEIEKAQKEIQKILKQQPTDYQLYLDMGDLYLLAQEFSQAEKMYAKARALKPEAPEVYLAFSNLYLVQGRLKEAEEQILQAIEKAQERALPLAGYRAYLAEFYVRTQRPAEALAIYQELSAQETNNYFYSLRLAELAIHLKRFALANQTLEAIEKKFPELFEIPYLRGHIALLEGHYKDAIGYFSQAVSMSEDPRAFFYLGVAQWLSGFRQQARINLKKAVTKDPMLVEAKLILAALEMEAGEAVLVRATLLDLLPYEPKAHLLALALSLREGDCERAKREITLLQKTGNLPPVLEKIYRYRCLAKPLGSAEKLPLQAWSLFRSRPEELPQKIEPTLYARALEVTTLWEQGKSGAAKEALAHLQGENPVVFYLRALQAYQEGEKETAITLLEKVVSRLSFFPAETLLGELYFQEGDYQAAAEAFRRALIIEPKNALVLNNLAWVLVRLAEKEGTPLPEEAVTTVEKLAELAPEDPAALDTVATVYHLAGMKEVSCRTLRRARELAPEDQIINKHYESWCSASP